jgi:hypothetical protein
MSREGVSIAARDRARRLQAALGEGATVLMGYSLIVLNKSPRRAVASGPAAPGNVAANDAADGTATAGLAGAERRR